MADRRYTFYRIHDVWACLVNGAEQFGLELVHGSVYGNSLTVRRSGIEYRAVVLTRSSDWYQHSLNVSSTFVHGITCVICGTHDSCLAHVPVLAIDARRWYEPLEMRLKNLAPRSDKLDTAGRAHDSFDRLRKSAYGHRMLIGALLCGRDDAYARLNVLPARTRRRIETEMKRLQTRRKGRPLKIWPVSHIQDQPEYIPDA